MDKHDVMRPRPLVHPEKLTAFLRDDDEYPGSSVETAWTPDDYVAMWRMMLATELVVAFAPQGLSEASAAQQIGREASPPIGTVGQLLRHPRPPIDLLKMLKDLAKRDSGGREGGLPRAIAVSLYHGAILTAIVRLGKSISTLTVEELRFAAQKLVARGWLDKDTVELAVQYVRQS